MVNLLQILKVITKDRMSKFKGAFKHRWSSTEERVLLDIINNGDDGVFKRVIIDNVTNVRLSRHDAWVRVM